MNIDQLIKILLIVLLAAVMFTAGVVVASMANQRTAYAGNAMMGRGMVQMRAPGAMMQGYGMVRPGNSPQFHRQMMQGNRGTQMMPGVGRGEPPSVNPVPPQGNNRRAVVPNTAPNRKSDQDNPGKRR